VFHGNLDAPLVIIGAGLTGVMTAYAAAAAGMKVLVLEADRLGHGGSGRSAGIGAGEASASFLGLQQAAGRRVARSQFDHVRRAVLDLGATIRRLNVKCDFAMLDAIRLVSPGTSAAAAAKDVDARHEVGLEATWLKTSAFRKASGAEASEGARLAPWAACDPYRLVVGFAKAATARGAKIFERSTVSSITFDRVTATVITPHGRIVSPHVVHCTGEPTGLVRGLKRHFRWSSRGLVLTEPLPKAVSKSIGPHRHVAYDTGAPPHAMRWTPDDRVLVSGRDGTRPKAAQAARLDLQRSGELMYELTRLYPDISGVMPAYGWSLELAHSLDGGLCVGPHRNFPHQLFAFGTEHDPARAFLASRILLRHLQQSTTSDDEQFGLGRIL
jgi:glycine/D-amino acid oxidase-like deaminating enzyme